MPTSLIDALLYGKKARFADARGRPARLIGAAPVPTGGSPEAAEAARVARSITRKGLSSGDYGCLAMAGAWVVLGATSVTITVISNAQNIPDNLPQVIALWLGVVVLAVLSVWASVRVHGSRRIAAELVARGLCAQCGYGIGGVPPEADGCTVCPECAAAWRVPEPSDRS